MTLILYFLHCCYSYPNSKCYHALLALILLFITLQYYSLYGSFLFRFAYILVYMVLFAYYFIYNFATHMRTYSLMQRSNALILIGYCQDSQHFLIYNFIANNLYTSMQHIMCFINRLQLFTSYCLSLITLYVFRCIFTSIALFLLYLYRHVFYLQNNFLS